MKRVFRILIMALVLTMASGGPLMAMGGQVDINRANAETLTGLKGIGPSKAAAIVSYREENGPFTQIEDLKSVKGIGEMTLERNRSRLVVRKNKDGSLSEALSDEGNESESSPDS